MTQEEFESKFKKSTRFDRYYYHALCFAIIGFSLFVLFKLLTDKDSNSDKTPPYIGSIGFLLLSVYGLFVLTKRYQLEYWKNNLPKEINIELLNRVCTELLRKNIIIEDNYIHFTYSTSWWRMSYDVHLFADENIIVINVVSVSTGDGGFIDFGASKRTQNKILNLIKANH